MNSKKDYIIYLVVPFVLLVTISALYFRGDRVTPKTESAESTKTESEKKAEDSSNANVLQAGATPVPTVTQTPEEVATSEDEIINPEGMTLRERVRVMSDCTRISYETGTFGDFVRNYPMKKDGAAVKIWDGTKKENTQYVQAVFKLPMEKRDLQQAADSVMRMYAEYLWNTDQKDKITFKMADGFDFDYKNWMEGGRLDFTTGATKWVQSGKEEDSYDNFKEYLRIVFSYAGTTSMMAESKKVKLKEIEIGDIFIESGINGHVCMVVDVCERNGKRAFLLAQGYSPAQQFYLLKNPEHENDPWYYVDEIKYPLKTPDYTFNKGSLMRPNYLGE